MSDSEEMKVKVIIARLYLVLYLVPSTVVSILHILTHLILTLTLSERYYNFFTYKEIEA